MDENLASALSQSTDLRVLVFRVEYVAIKGIIELIHSLKSLSLFHVYTVLSSGFASCESAHAAAKSLREIIEKKGRIVDLTINVNQPFHKLQCPDHFRWFPT